MISTHSIDLLVREAKGTRAKVSCVKRTNSAAIVFSAEAAGCGCNSQGRSRTAWLTISPSSEVDAGTLAGLGWNVITTRNIVRAERNIG